MTPNDKTIVVPLTSATIEVRFPGDARIDNLRGEFQQSIRGEFPLLFLPKLETGDSPSLLHYRFTDENRTRAIDVAIHSFIYESEVYPGWKSFLDEFLHYWGILSEKLQLDTLTRIAIRYENRFPSEWKDYIDFKRSPSYMAALKEDALFYRSLIRLEKSGHDLVVSVYMPQDAEELQVDYDAFVDKLSSPEQLKGVLDILHSTVEEEFLTSIDQRIAQALDIAQ